MTAATLNKINAEIAKHGVELVKGEGYFWFAALEGAPMGVEDRVPSVWTCHLRSMSLEQWVGHVETALKETEGND